MQIYFQRLIQKAVPWQENGGKNGELTKIVYTESGNKEKVVFVNGIFAQLFGNHKNDIFDFRVLKYKNIFAGPSIYRKESI